MAIETTDKSLHVRRCHLCNGITECEGERVSRCGHCGKPLAHFFFFDEMQVKVIADTELTSEQLGSGERKPIRGLTAFW